MPSTQALSPDVAALCNRVDKLLAALEQREAQTVPPSPYIGMAELATQMGVDERTVKAWKASGQLPKPIRMGRMIRWLRADLEAFMRAKAKQK